MLKSSKSTRQSHQKVSLIGMPTDGCRTLRWNKNLTWSAGKRSSFQWWNRYLGGTGVSVEVDIAVTNLHEGIALYSRTKNEANEDRYDAPRFFTALLSARALHDNPHWKSKKAVAMKDPGVSLIPVNIWLSTDAEGEAFRGPMYIELRKVSLMVHGCSMTSLDWALTRFKVVPWLSISHTVDAEAIIWFDRLSSQASSQTHPPLIFYCVIFLQCSHKH